MGQPLHTREYYAELKRRGPVYQPDQVDSSWVRFNLTAYHQQAQMCQGRFEQSGRVWGLLSQFAESSGLDERMVSALYNVAMTGHIRRSRYEQAEGASAQQAEQDLRDLASSGVLEPVGHPRIRYYVAGPFFPDEAQDAAETPIALKPAYS